jgi:tetratricopeptide (TPR) repeat protein
MGLLGWYGLFSNVNKAITILFLIILSSSLVVTINPSYVTAQHQNEKGNALYSQGNYAEALKYYDKVLAIDPNDIDALIKKGNILDELKQQREQQLTTNTSGLTNNEIKNQISTLIPMAMSDYTFMVYIVGSDLEAKSYAATQNIRQMENVGSNSKVNVIIETGGGSAQTMINDKRFIDFTKVQRHKILHNNIQTLADLGQQNMGDSKTLSDFIMWGMSNFPAKKYAIVLWDHGSGINGFGGDLQFNNDKLTLDEISQAFLDSNNNKNNNKKFELIGFDSCLMASIEVANSIKTFGNYMVSSQEIEPQWGWSYSSILRSLTEYPNEDGSLLGKTIADSFLKKSQSLSASQGYNVQEVTISVVNLTKIQGFVKDLDTLANYLINQITNSTSVISLTKSVGSSEGYGKTFKGNSGLVDIYDLSSNIKQRFPQSSNLVDAVQKSLKNIVVYKVNGDATPNANGLSIYMPIKQNEFTSSIKYTLPNWQKIVDLQYRLIKDDREPPILQSDLFNDTIKGHIYGNDVASVTLWIYASLPEGNSAFVEELDPSSFINSDDSFQYKWKNQIISLCSEQQQHICKPTLMHLEINKDKKFALIPVRLKSNTDNINEHVSLVYEINKEGGFTFLGARPEVNEQGTVPKENWPLKPKDRTLPLAYTFDWKDYTNLTDIEYDPIQVTAKFGPRYIHYNGTFDIALKICDYSDNCWETRFYHFGEIPKMQSQAVNVSRYNISSCKENSPSSNVGNFSKYVNPIYGFAIQYPSNWQKKDKGLPDPDVVGFGPSQFNPDGVNIAIAAEYWPQLQSPKDLLNSIAGTIKDYDPFSNITEPTSETRLGVYPAYKLVTTKNDQGVLKQNILIQTLIDHSMYRIIIWIPYKSYYLSIIKKMLDSFDICKNTENIALTQRANAISNQGSNLTIKANNKLAISTVRENNFPTYESHIFKFKIRYPSNWTINEDENRRQVSFVSAVKPNTSSLISKASSVALLVSVFPNTMSTFSIDRLGKELINMTSQGRIGFHLIDSNLTTFKGNQSYKMISTYIDANQHLTIKNMAIVTIVNNNMYLFEYFGESSNYDLYIPIIQKMLNSFEGL